MTLRLRPLRASLLAAALLLPATNAKADFIGVCFDGSLVLISETTGAVQLLGVTTVPGLTSLARSERYGLLSYSHQIAQPWLVWVNPITAQAGVQTYPALNDVRAMASDSNGVFYALDAIGGGAENRLYWIDLTLPPGDPNVNHHIGTLSIGGSTGTYVTGMTDGPNGLLYAWSVVYGLITIDSQTAATTDVNAVMDGGSAIQTLAWTPSGELYGAYNQLYLVDPLTGAKTPIGSPFPYSVTGIEYWDPLSPTRFCDPGVGGVLGCPCSNPALGSARGCNNSAGTGGASLVVGGTASLAADTLVLTSLAERPSVLSILIQHTVSTTQGAFFGQGVRCMAGTFKRLYQKVSAAGSVSCPGPFDPGISARSAALGDVIAPASSRYYGIYYRDGALGGCPVSGRFNITNQLAIYWSP